MRLRVRCNRVVGAGFVLYVGFVLDFEIAPALASGLGLAEHSSPRFSKASFHFDSKILLRNQAVVEVEPFEYNLDSTSLESSDS